MMPLPYEAVCTEDASHWLRQWSVPASLFPSTRLALIWLRIFYKIFRTENASHWLRQWGLPSAGARVPFSEYLLKFYAGCAMRVVAKINGSCVRQM